MSCPTGELERIPGICTDTPFQRVDESNTEDSTAGHAGTAPSAVAALRNLADACSGQLRAGRLRRFSGGGRGGEFGGGSAEVRRHGAGLDGAEPAADVAGGCRRGLGRAVVVFLATTSQGQFQRHEQGPEARGPVRLRVGLRLDEGTTGELPSTAATAPTEPGAAMSRRQDGRRPPGPERRRPRLRVQGRSRSAGGSGAT